MYVRFVIKGILLPLVFYNNYDTVIFSVDSEVHFAILYVATIDVIYPISKVNCNEFLSIFRTILRLLNYLRG